MKDSANIFNLIADKAKAKLGVSADGKTISECVKELLNK